MEKHTEGPKTDTSPIRQKSKIISRESSDSADQSFYQQNLFLSLALDMTWQLAVVVVVPIIGGFFLDKRLGTSPWLTLAGFLVAAIGMVGVLTRIVGKASQRSKYPKDGDKS